MRAICTAALMLCACAPARTEVAVNLRSSRGVSLATLELHVTVDETAASPVVMLRERGGAPRLPGETLLEVPANATTVTVLAVATTPDGSRRSAVDGVRVRRNGRVELTLRLEFGDQVPDGGPLDRLSLGAPCAVDEDCASGFCVDGLCCDRRCDEGDCFACSVAGGGLSDGVCGPRRAGTECRAATGPCDVAEACDGASAACPADARAGAVTVCRPSVGSCDLDEVCDGAAAECPIDVTKCAPSEYCGGTACVPKKTNGGACTADVQCTSGFCTDGYCCNARCQDGACDRCNEPGMLGVCRLSDAATVCVAATSPCEVDRFCTGTSGVCPPGMLKPAGTVCRSAIDACDQEEVCTGTSAACPAVDKLQPAGTVCRAQADGCDLAEVCNGAVSWCPTDQRRPTTEVVVRTTSRSDGTYLFATSSIDASQVTAAYDQFTGNPRIGLLSWETATVIPAGAVVGPAEVELCLDGASGPGTTKLYKASFPVPVANAGTTQQFLANVPEPASGWVSVSIPGSAIERAGPTQVHFLPVSAGYTFERRGAAWASSPSMYPSCPIVAPETLAPRLHIHYCYP